jgi:hypothetical protein
MSKMIRVIRQILTTKLASAKSKQKGQTGGKQKKREGEHANSKRHYRTHPRSRRLRKKVDFGKEFEMPHDAVLARAQYAQHESSAR